MTVDRTVVFYAEILENFVGDKQTFKFVLAFIEKFNEFTPEKRQSAYSAFYVPFKRRVFLAESES